MIKHDQPWKYDVQNEVKKPVLEMVKIAEIWRQLLTPLVHVLCFFEKIIESIN